MHPNTPASATTGGFPKRQTWRVSHPRSTDRRGRWGTENHRAVAPSFSHGKFRRNQEHSALCNRLCAIRGGKWPVSGKGIFLRFMVRRLEITRLKASDSRVHPHARFVDNAGQIPSVRGGRPPKRPPHAQKRLRPSEKSFSLPARNGVVFSAPRTVGSPVVPTTYCIN